jgi:hypothetical protein
MILRPAGRFLIRPFPPFTLAARFFAAVILPPLLFLAILCSCFSGFDIKLGEASCASPSPSAMGCNPSCQKPESRSQRSGNTSSALPVFKFCFLGRELISKSEVSHRIMKTLFIGLATLALGAGRARRQLARNPAVPSPPATPSHMSDDAHEPGEPADAPQISERPSPSTAPRPA